MFEKFGEFNSAEELNMAADGLLNEGDIESLEELAKENGIDEGDLQDYIDGYAEDLATVSSAAFGRLDIEEKEEIDKIKNPMERMAVKVILTMLRGMCTEEAVAAAVVRKGKRVTQIFKAMKSAAEKHKNGNVGMSCGTDRQLCGIIRSYYLESDKQFKKEIEKLYE